LRARTTTHACFVLMTLAGGVATASAADKFDSTWTLGVTGGALGAGPEFAWRPTKYLGLRVNAGFFNYNRDETVDQISYNGKLKLNSYGAMVDLFPFAGGFRLSAGGRSNNNKIDLTGTPSSAVTVGNNVYTPAEVGTLSGTAKGNDFAPTVTFGYGGSFARGFTFGAELGVMFQGSPKISNYQATGQLATNPAFQADLQTERARVEDKVHNYQYWPIAQIEVLYRF
jgi:hypothetical protein